MKVQLAAAVAVVAWLATTAATVWGASAPKQALSAEETARELANPNTPLATLTLKNQLRLFEGDLPGPDDESSLTMLFQPAIPFPLANGDTVFVRPAIPLLIEQPFFDPGRADFGSRSGLGDIAFDLAYGRTTASGIIAAAGIISTLPTATSDRIGSAAGTGRSVPNY